MVKSMWTKRTLRYELQRGNVRIGLENSRLRKLCGELQVEADRKGVKQRD